MANIKINDSLKDYKEIIQKLNPLLSDGFVNDVQDYIEHQFVTYTPEEIESETFLTFVADGWPSEVTIDQAKEQPLYSFSLYRGDESVIDVDIVLGLNEAETDIMVVDLNVEEV